MVSRFHFFGTLICVAVVFLYSCVFIVDQRQYAVIFELGEIKSVISNPGLYFKLPPPFHNVQYFEKRIITLDASDSDRFITSEKLNVMVNPIVKWKIINLQSFIRSASGSLAVATDRINRSLRDALNNAIARQTVAEMISGGRAQLVEGIRKKMDEDARQIGVSVVGVLLRRVNFAPEVSERVFARMASERKQVANQRRATGSAESEKIRAEADRERVVILAEAYRDAQTVMGEGDAQASQLFAQAYGAHPGFATFYRSLAAYRKAHSPDDVMLINPEKPTGFFQYFQGNALGSH